MGVRQTTTKLTHMAFSTPWHETLPQHEKIHVTALFMIC